MSEEDRKLQEENKLLKNQIEITDEEIYEEYEKRHPEDIHSDFILFEDGNEDYIEEIIQDLKRRKSNEYNG